MPDIEAIASCRKVLAAFLLASVPGIQQVIDGWPYGNTALNMPSVSVFSGKDTYMNFPPTEIAVAPLAGNQVLQTLRVGEHDFKIQLDLWARNKVERDKFAKEIRDAFSSQAITDKNVSGLSLQMADYFDEWARFDLDGSENIESEDPAQTGEWRCKFDVLVNCNEIVERTGPKMRIIETFIGATPLVEQMTKDTDFTDESVVP